MSELTVPNIISLMRKNYTLVDTDDYNLDNELPLVQKAIDTKCNDTLHEMVDEWFIDEQMESVDQIIEILKGEFSYLEERKVECFFNDNYDAISEEIYNRASKNDPFNEVLENTTAPVFFLKTGYETIYGYDDESHDENFKTVKEALGIDENETKYDKKINLLINESYSGGNIVVYFCEELEVMLDLDQVKRVTFKDPYIAVTDRMNGSGADTQFVGLELSMDFSIDDLYIDKILHYNYSYQVSGLSDGWCGDTEVKWLKS